jgi:hypothetical protein
MITKQLIEFCANSFGSHPRYSISDNALSKVIKSFPKNDELESAIIKVTIIKTLYATTLYDVFKMANHIHGITNIDALILEGNPQAVERIRKGHGIVTTKSLKEIDFYSFSTKYCSFHNQMDYPIYDNLVANIIVKEFGSKRDLKNYAEYKNEIIRFRRETGIETESFKQIDMGLWVYSKYKENKMKPSKNTQEQEFFLKIGPEIEELEERE